MSKNRFLFIVSTIFSIAAIAGCIVFAINHRYINEATFSGSRVRNPEPDRFYLSFDIMNRDDSEVMFFEEGEVMQVSWNIEHGKVDVSIACDDDKPIYTANGRGNGDSTGFELTIPKSGDYTISITGKKARGWMEFIKLG